MKIIYFQITYKSKLLTLYPSIWAAEPYGELFDTEEVNTIIEKQEIILLAIDANDEIAGFIAGHNFDGYSKYDEVPIQLIGGNTFYLSELAVAPAYRRRGFAAKLYQELEEWAVSKNYDQIILRTSAVETNPAIPFYDGNGFKEIVDIVSEVEQKRVDGRPVADYRKYFIKDIGNEITFRLKYNYDAVVNRFKRKHNVSSIIGISGGADTVIPGLHFEDPLQLQLQKAKKSHQALIITEFLQSMSGYGVAVLTGGTEGGIPQLATEIAKKLNFKTIGVFPETGSKYALGQDLLDLRISVESSYGPSTWGDEAAVWTAMIDGVMVVGGGSGTLIEYAHLLKLNESKVKKQLQPKFIVPISKSGGTSEYIHFLCTNTDLKNKIMPQFNVTSGQEAAKFLIEKLGLCDYFDYKLIKNI